MLYNAETIFYFFNHCLEPYADYIDFGAKSGSKTIPDVISPEVEVRKVQIVTNINPGSSGSGL